MRLGIDVGGTFTDIVLIDDQSGSIHYTKTLTTPADLAQGVLAGIGKILEIAGAAMDQIEYIVHGTTIGTNALIERKGGRVGLITTAGFRDVLEIGRIERPDGGLYDMSVDLPEPLVPRYLRLEVEERVGADGEVVKPLDERTVRDSAAALKDYGVEAIAVSLLFSFRNPAHEQRVSQICSELLPDVPVTISSEVAPEFREFERTSTTVINAYLLPVTRRYLDALQERLKKDYGHARLRIMQASGGSMTAEVAKSHAVNMVNSGPAGGALATALFGGLAGIDGVIGIDMGGTSFDICLIIDGTPRIKAEGEFEGFPVKIPLMDVEGIGAGGGSIAWVDAGGALNVGPQSAGADPGPSCYGAGGTLPTVTDANLILGRLNPEYFLGGEMALDLNAAQEAVRRGVSEPMGLSLEEAAAGIIRVVNANMVRGISVNSTQKGYDVREFSLLAFGGAGPLHAIELADDMGMDQVIIPPFCSVFSAFGAVTSDVRHDYVQTVALPQKEANAPALQSLFDQLEARARQRLAEEKIPDEQVELQRAADLRYEGQSYELTIPIPTTGALKEEDVEKVIKDFHEWHDHLYAYSEPGESVEFINLRLTGIGNVPDVHLLQSAAKKRSKPKPKSERPVYFPGQGFLTSKIYERRDLVNGQSWEGPCLVEETTSTTVIPPGWRATVDAYDNLIADREK
jgi:N-methylhydantoinase A